MVLNQACRDVILRAIHRRTSGLGGRVKIAGAKVMINNGIRSVHKSDYSINIVDYIHKYHPHQVDKLSMAPACAKKATVGELIDFYHELKRQF